MSQAKTTIKAWLKFKLKTKIFYSSQFTLKKKSVVDPNQIRSDPELSGQIGTGFEIIKGSGSKIQDRIRPY